jgi:hypothetical protein
MYIHVFDHDVNINKKYCYSNIYQKRMVKGPSNMSHIIPNYDLYKVTFNLCDRANRALHDRTFRHRTGGRSHGGEDGYQHKFAMAVILQNIYNLYNSMNAECEKFANFSAFCFSLADDIYEYACNYGD